MNRLRSLSPLTLRLLAFNFLLVFLPVAGNLSLGTYERQLLASQERAMVQQGRLLAAALARGAADDSTTAGTGGDPGGLDVAEAERVLAALNRRLEARLRVVDASGRVVADSSGFGPRRDQTEVTSKISRNDPPASRENVLYRVASAAYQLYRRVRPGPELPTSEAGLYSTAEPGGTLSGLAVREALAGRYGADLRVTRGSGPEGRAFTTLHIAIPIPAGERVIGAALVSQSTFRILRALSEVRLSNLQVFAASLVAAFVLSLLVSTTIARPLVRLRDEARALVDRRGRLKGRFQGSEKRGEIGDLARALEDLTRRLEQRARLTESFAAELSHEFKNPLASIRMAAEMLGDVESGDDRLRFQRMILDQGARLEHLLSAVREISGIDLMIDQEEASPLRLDRLLAAVAEGYRLRGEEVDLGYLAPVFVRATPERLAQVVENLLDNAIGFSRSNSDSPPVRLQLTADEDFTTLTVTDRGPGIPTEHLDRIFDRFFTYRRDSDREGHIGLGLAIARAIVEGYGGTLTADNVTVAGKVRGARFTVRLPRERK
ncbi:MAG: ATP-binding protein [Acidobacteriota bacterium]